MSDDETYDPGPIYDTLERGHEADQPPLPGEESVFTHRRPIRNLAPLAAPEPADA